MAQETAERISARPLSELDRASRERLENLLGVEPTHLTDGDRAFLTARKDYLTADQRKDFGIKGKVNLENIEQPEESETGENANAGTKGTANTPAPRAPRKRAAKKAAKKRTR